MSARVYPLLLALWFVSAASLAAQSVRVTGSTGVRYIELRPFVRDSVAADAAAGAGLLRQLTDGRVVRCIPGEAFCHDVRAGSRTAAVPVITDVEASAWGFGEGLRLYAHVRARGTWHGDRELWPRSDDALEVLAAYGELERGRLRARAGRLWKVSGLGFYNFDGFAANVRAHASLALEAYAGRSLLRGINEPRTGGALQSIESLAPPAAGLLAGLQARYRPHARLALGATYQVDFRDDGAGLFAELFAGDGVLHVGRTVLEAAIEHDVASNSLNEARLRVRTPPLLGVAPFAEVRRYRPYFELWTIWGAFSPVGFDEAQAGATWATARGRVMLRGDGAYRRYGDSFTDLGLDPMRSTGWSVRGALSWSPAEPWRLDAAYRVETGVGAARRDGHVGVQRQLGEVGSVALQAVAFQRLYEFRLSEGTVAGLGAELSLRLSERAQLNGNAALYRHLGAGPVPTLDWTQRRASLRVQWTVGAEPGGPGGGA